MNLQQLEYVDAVSRHRSLRAASEALGVTPQALSRAIGALERELSAQIFERAAGGGVNFTPFGAQLHQKIIQALRLRDQIAESAASTTRRRLSIGCGYVFSTSSLTALTCKAFDVLGYERIDWVTGANVQLTPRVAAGELDFAFTTQTPHAPRLHFTPYLEFGWAVACRRDHPLAASGALGAVSRYGFVAASSPSGHAMIERATRALSGRSAQITATADGVIDLIRLVQTSDRLALVPDTFCTDLAGWAGLRLIAAPSLPKRSYGVLTPRRPPVGLDWGALSKAVDAVFAEFIASRKAGA
ncbi:MAG: LysR family transcriptional regulator [Oceanicaulis sp.]